MPYAITCPQCNGPITPHRFARSIVCPYCGNTVELDETSVLAETFHEAFRIWNDPASYGISSWVSFGDSHWTLDKHLARGSISDVYAGWRARWPTELVILKLLRDPKNSNLFDNEWAAIQTLQKSTASGADTFTRLIPQPVLHGDSTGGAFVGRRVTIFRWASGFHHTFEKVRQAYPDGIPPQASIWVWRRILEVLTFIHNSGMAHGAILPAHLLVQEGEHGVRLVGYSFAGRTGEQLRSIPTEYKSYYPSPSRSWSKLSAQLDLVMSARCVAHILGGDPETASLPGAVPPELAEIIRRIALSKYDGPASEDAWTIREELGAIAKKVFGPPAFIPIEM